MSLKSQKSQNYSLIILRAALGIILFAHGAQKLLGWFGGFGFDATLQFFQQQLGIPQALAAISILVEFFGGLMVLLGLFTRVGAALIAVNMAVALITVHLPQGFFIAGGKVGIEFTFALVLMALYLTINGAGSLSVDRFIREKVVGSPLEGLLS